MKLSISKKLILSFLGLTLVILVSTLGLARWSFEQGFLDYVNALEEARLKLVATSLSREYVDAGSSWSTVSRRRFEEILWEHAPAKLEEASGAGRPPPRGLMLSLPRRPSPDSSSAKWGPELGPPTALYNVHGELVAGSLPSAAETRPIRVPVLIGGEPVGELRSEPRRQFSLPQETAFSRQQWITSGLIGFVSLMLAVVVSLFLTRVLLAPIRRTIAAIAQLSSGDYSVRLDERRSDELGRLMGDLDKLAYKLEESRSSRQRWLASISHELRTPVTVLIGEIEAMKDGIRPLDMVQILSLDQEVARLHRLIDDLYELSVSDIGGLRYSSGPVDIMQCVTAAADAIRTRAGEKGIDLNVSGETGKMISADSQRLDQLFVNLFENSLAYTDSPGRIEISLASSGAKIVVRIQDTPPGVDADECEKLFEPLYRHEMSRSRRTAGAGLGLAICRNIVEAHQGTITATPSELGGLCIELVFPITAGT
ncbi:ATP-binding protein [Marinobacter sp. ANT_B65]|uniref:ATP-binding protein n=1 Tax=Marinobacter sp. ANT_B65 TaxID=2039467 RepID=UPI00117F3C03|nr:ATP-binding protein [Marinobacter sp. ANT_B65]